MNRIEKWKAKRDMIQKENDDHAKRMKNKAYTFEDIFWIKTLKRGRHEKIRS